MPMAWRWCSPVRATSGIELPAAFASDPAHAPGQVARKHTFFGVLRITGLGVKYFLILFAFLFPFVAMAGQKEEDAYDVLDKYCLGTELGREAMLSLLERTGASKLSAEEAQARLGLPGEMWWIRTGLADYWVFTTGAGICGVNHASLDFQQMTAITAKRLKTKPTSVFGNEVVTVSTFSTQLPGDSNDKAKTAVKVILEISALRVNPKSNVTSLAVVLESVYGSVLREVKPPARCPDEGANQALCS